MPLKIAVYAIALNEILHVKRFCEAAKDADLIFVADTGSTDGTVEALEACGAVVKPIRIKPWRFDDARNAALAMLPADIDVCMSLDLDEILQPGWREEIERVWTPGTTRLRYMFDWGGGKMPDGKGIAFFYEKCHGRFNYRWHHPCHEYPIPDRIEEVWAQTEKLLVVHEPDPSKSRGQYLDLLRVSVEEDPQCPRNGFYYGRELSFSRQWVEAIVQLRKYLELPRATWHTERCYAMRTIGRCYAELGDRDQALVWFERSAKEAPETREPWCEIAGLCYRMENWQRSYDAALKALEITDWHRVYTVDPQAWGAQPHDYAAIAAYHLGLTAEAVKHAEKALSFEPENERLKANVEWCRGEKKSAA